MFLVETLFCMFFSLLKMLPKKTKKRESKGSLYSTLKTMQGEFVTQEIFQERGKAVFRSSHHD